MKKRKGEIGAYAMECVAAGAYLSTPWLFKLMKRPDHRVELLPGLQFSFRVQTHGIRFVWTGTRPPAGANRDEASAQ